MTTVSVKKCNACGKFQEDHQKYYKVEYESDRWTENHAGEIGGSELITEEFDFCETCLRKLPAAIKSMVHKEANNKGEKK